MSRTSLRLASVLSMTGLALTALVTVGGFAEAQNPAETTVPRSVMSEAMRVCAGYIGAEVPEDLQIVGSEKEAYVREFSQGDLVYINRGRDANLQTGAEYQIIRNIGPVRDLQDRQRVLGTLVQELGVLRITEVRDTSSTGEITLICTGTVNLGDVLIPYERRPIPKVRTYRPLSVVGAPTGRATGQILASQMSREQLVRNDVVYVNIGADNGIKVGDYLTVYRPLASDPVSRFRDDRVGQRRSNGFPSDRFRTRDNSSIASSNKGYPQVAERTPRSELPRTLVGEIIIIRTEANTAVGVLTRTTREAVIGDRVELQ
ncbi:MAG: hypothetical protein SNJ62_11545 [Chloracidobacterium sp.]|uniref:Flagella basal body P-ring formation protein FlgA n=1 Tax=Chloracidobacterium validum TaxID=2821543 RepID=A0ABX8B8Z1_9BACT|nr:hypothetical protein [Chloracidobacterium validum]QUW02912.1 hypothetical protein J8C06_00220 [Chloracidobacterium validum]